MDVIGMMGREEMLGALHGGGPLVGAEVTVVAEAGAAAAAAFIAVFFTLASAFFAAFLDALAFDENTCL